MSKKRIERLADLTPDPINANRGTERGAGMLERSLRQHGAGRSILADKNGVVLAGNKTLEQAAAMGLEIQPVHTDGSKLVVVVRDDLDYDDPAAKSLAIYDNRVSETNLAWSVENLQQVFDAGVDGNEFWFPEELSALFSEAEAEATAALTDPDTVPEPPKEPITKPGDLIRLGAHALLCGDATNADHIDRVLGSDKPSMVFADPPYAINAVDERTGQTGGLGRPGGGYPFGGAKNDGKSKPIKAKVYAPVIGDDSTETAVSAYRLISSLLPGAVQVWWGANNYAHVLPPSTCWIVWDKENGTNAFADAELAWVSSPTAVRIFRHMWNGMVKASERGESRVHPTQKPVALAEWCFNEYGKPGEAIFDPFAGSGITIIAGERTGHPVRAIEMSPAYCDVIVNRWQDFTGQTATLERRAD